MSRLGRPRKLRPPRKSNRSRRGVATAIGSILFFVIALQIIAFLYEVNQVHTEMVSFDIERSRESLQITSIGFNDRSPSSIQISSGQILSGDVASLGSTDSNRLTLNSEQELTALHPTSYNLVGSTALVSGGTSLLTSDDGSYLIFRSYASSFSPTTPTRALIGYRSNTGTFLTNSLKGSSWDGNSWSSEEELPSAGSPVRWVRVAHSPISARFYERIVVTLSDDGYLDANVWDGSSWLGTNDIGFVGTIAAAYRPFDIVYETMSGDAILVYGISSIDTTQDLAYRVWNGLSWSAEVYIDDPSISDIQYTWVQLASYPLNTGRADEIALIGIDGSGSDANAWIWNGIAWGNYQELTSTVTRTIEEDISVEYEQISGDAMFIWGNGNKLESRKWTGSWQSQLPDVGGGFAVDSVTANQGDASSFTHSHTVSGSDRLLVVSVHTDSGINIAGVTYAGQSLTLVQNSVHGGGAPRVAVYRLINAPTGANNVVVTLSSSDKTTIGAVSYTGVDQTTPIDGVTSATGSSTSASVTVTSETGDLVQDAMTSIAVGSPTVGALQTQRYNREMGGSGASSHYGGGSTEPGAASVTMSWSLQEAKEWAIIGFNLNTSTVAAAIEARWFTLKADPSSNRLMAVITNKANELQTVYWSGSSWVLAPTHDTGVDSLATRVADFDWEPSGSKGLLVWGTISGSLSWRTFAPPSTWGTISTETNSGTHPWVQLRRNTRDVAGDLKIVGATLNSNNDLYIFEWDGEALRIASAISTDVAGTTWESFDLSLRRFGNPTYTAEAEFIGSGGGGASALKWIVDSSWTVGKVDVMMQLFSYGNNQYVQDLSTYDGKAYLNYESTNIPNLDETKTKTISTDVGDFFDSNGNWKIKVKGEKETETQFDLKVDIVEYELTLQKIDWHGVFSITEPLSSVGGLEVIYAGHSDSTITKEIYIYNFTGATWDRLARFSSVGVESTVGPLPNGSLASHYLSGSSQVLISVNNTASDSFIAYANYLHLRVVPMAGAGVITIEVLNSGGNDIHLVDLWIIDGNNRSLWNSASSQPFDKTVFPGESYSTSVGFDWAANETYRIKVVTERGGIWSRVITP